jgi:putative pyruvate formate lyase activating enzyme
MSVYEGLGAHLHFAFSRIPGHRKDHVQDLVLKEAAAVWNEVFERSGRVYVCGRLELVDGVRNALRHVAMTSGGLDDEAAERAVQNLQDGGRLLTDCWSVDAPYLQPMNRGEPEHSPHVVLRLERHHAPAARPQHVAQSVDLTKVPAWPSYLRLLASGELERRVERAMDMFSACVACGRYCETNRLSSDPEDWGECRVGTFSIVASAFPHFGEESCLVGTKGSGTIFFGACNLKCVYCQNWELSAMDEGEVFNDDRLAETMLMLQRKGCHNINFVSPTHNVAPILRAVLIAARKGLKLPLVWNTGGYDSVASLRLLEGVVDIFMPDAKYASRAVGRKLSKVDNYPEINQAAIKEMHRQVGELQIDRRTGLARRGVLVRHLVLPHDLAGTCCVASFLAKEISKDTFTNVMDQYRPEHKAKKDKKLGLARKPTRNELDHAHNEARSAGLRRFDGDEAESNSSNLEW